jgi:hypothetical protein
MQYIADGIAHPVDDSPAVITTATARLTDAQMGELSTRVMAIIDEYVDAYRDQTGDGVRAVSIRADIFPLPEEGH